MKPISIPEWLMWFLRPAAAAAESVESLGIRYSADVTEGEGGKDERLRVGLCFDCQHSQRIQSDRGSIFYRCTLAESDSTFPKYPRLPVLHCARYIQKD